MSTPTKIKVIYEEREQNRKESVTHYGHGLNINDKII